MGFLFLTSMYLSSSSSSSSVGRAMSDPRTRDLDLVSGRALRSGFLLQATPGNVRLLGVFGRWNTEDGPTYSKMTSGSFSWGGFPISKRNAPLAIFLHPFCNAWEMSPEIIQPLKFSFCNTKPSFSQTQGWPVYSWFDKDVRKNSCFLKKKNKNLFYNIS